ncbi:MAG: winged helix-turn-helix domain-containing protein [Bryobacteraceae bacterium]
MLPGTRRQPSLWGFANFVFDRSADQLYKDGERLHLQGKPLLLLRVLLEQSGNLVTREDLRQRLWPDAQSLEFDAGLNTAIKMVRQALGDTARESVFIRTDRSQGYRFVYPIHYPTAISLAEPAVAAETGPPATAIEEAPRVPVLAPEPPPAKKRHRLSLVVFGIVAGTALLAGGVKLAFFRGEHRELSMEPLLNAPALPIMAAAISPDGRLFAFADEHHVHVPVISTTASSVISKFDGLRVYRLAWGRDSDTLFVCGFLEGERLPSLWQAWLLGESPRKKIRDDVWEVARSPDGKRLAMSDGAQQELWVSSADGSGARRLFRHEAGGIRNIWWSPRGERVWFARKRIETTTEVGSVGVADGKFRLALTASDLGGMVLLPDGRLAYVTRLPSGIRLFELDVDSETGQLRGAPRQRADWPSIRIDELSTTARGDQLAVIQGRMASNVWVAELADGNQKMNNARRLTREDADEYAHAWSPDSRAVIFESTQHGSWNLFQQAIDSDYPEPLAVGPDTSVMGRPTPDGGAFLFVRYVRRPSDAGPPAGYQLMRATWGGGPPVAIAQMDKQPNFRCPAAPAKDCVMAGRAGSEMVFSRLDPNHGPGARMFAIPSEDPNPDWDVSPDGRRIALTPKDAADNHIRIFSDTGVEQDVAVRGWSGLASLNFWADGKGFFAAAARSGHVDFLSITMRGQATRLDCDPGHLPVWVVASPDGRRIALNLHAYTSKAWLLRQF